MIVVLHGKAFETSLINMAFARRMVVSVVAHRVGSRHPAKQLAHLTIPGRPKYPDPFLFSFCSLFVLVRRIPTPNGPRRSQSREACRTGPHERLERLPHSLRWQANSALDQRRSNGRLHRAGSDRRDGPHLSRASLSCSANCCFHDVSWSEPSVFSSGAETQTRTRIAIRPHSPIPARTQ